MSSHIQPLSQCNFQVLCDMFAISPEDKTYYDVAFYQDPFDFTELQDKSIFHFEFKEHRHNLEFKMIHITMLK